MLKILGLAGFVAASGCVGIIKSLELRERVRLLEDFRRVMLQLFIRINYLREPLPAVLGRGEEGGPESADLWQCGDFAEPAGSANTAGFANTVNPAGSDEHLGSTDSAKPADPHESAAKDFLREVERALSEGGLTVPRAWRGEVERCYGARRLGRQDLEAMAVIGDFLGQTDWAGQEAQFRYAQELLCDRIEEARSDYGVKGRLYSRLGFFVGAMGAIIFM